MEITIIIRSDVFTNSLIIHKIRKWDGSDINLELVFIELSFSVFELKGWYFIVVAEWNYAEEVVFLGEGED